LSLQRLKHVTVDIRRVKTFYGLRTGRERLDIQTNRVDRAARLARPFDGEHGACAHNRGEHGPKARDLTLVEYVDPVLVVDELNAMTRIVDGMLRKGGFTNVKQLHDEPTALQKLRKKPFLFVMSDREMPGQLIRPPQS
jgi:hypothetical protein